MGMDVFGLRPIAPLGEYFRNNVWYWSPLWSYVVRYHENLLPDDPQEGFTNNSYQLNAKQAADLGIALLHDIKSGSVAEYEYLFNLSKSESDFVFCEYCSGTGIRTDQVGQEHGMPAQELDDLSVIVLGRTHGTCNSCHGLGRCEPFGNSYHFTLDNVRDFAIFLMCSGGIVIH